MNKCFTEKTPCFFPAYPKYFIPNAKLIFLHQNLAFDLTNIHIYQI